MLPRGRVPPAAETDLLKFQALPDARNVISETIQSESARTRGAVQYLGLDKQFQVRINIHEAALGGLFRSRFLPRNFFL